MSDSVEIAIKNICRTDLNKISEALKSSGLSLVPGGGFFALSPLTEAQYVVKIGNVKGGDGCLLASVNVPACTVGNNVLIQNRVWSACQFVVEMLRYQLTSIGVKSSIINKIKLQNVVVTAVTLTYLFRFESHKEALRALSDLSLNGELLWNLSCNPKKEKPVYRVGGSENFTAYFRSRMFKISAYVKSGPTPRSFSKFPDANVEEIIYAEGEKILRVEIKCFAALLAKNNYSSPSAWKKVAGAKNPYRFGMELIREYFRLDERLRERLPKQRDIATLSALDRDVLEWHFSGNDARQYPGLAGNPKKHSALKGRILSALRIDLSIPWLMQKRIRGYLSDKLTFSNRYRVPDALQDYSFCQKQVRALLRHLVKLTPVQESNRSLDNEELDFDIEFE
ncbi:MAG: hypothetical protein H6R16_1702 [Proteobacteria bacterium]|nr:hypothetical protein [Pseudomonadota bacterium]